ncbi:MAG TPA: DUF4407 domain-containing protein [Actinocrinis sp.]|nr:DUF4407 domain-containing protein [Actinocrinis sp.]
MVETTHPDGLVREPLADSTDGTGASAPPHPPVRPDRPAWVRTAAAGPRPATWIRVLTGVDESVLDRLPSERPRYTALACVMVCTSGIGGVSMFFALTEILGSFQVWFILLALFWSAFVLCLDRWLVASMAGRQFAARIATAAFRLLVAAVFGIIIAEPLVLRIFETAVVAHVQTERQNQIDQVRGMLKACNPITGAEVSTAYGTSCANFRLPFTAAAAQDTVAISALKDQITSEQNTISTETTQADALNQRVNQECNGVKVPGVTTGGFGDGPACHQDQQAYELYLTDHPVAQQNTVLSGYESRLTTLQNTESADADSAQAQLNSAIAARLGKETPVDGTIGLIERIDALSALAGSSTAVAATSWILRIFFVLIDCLPVLVKLSSGLTPYDELTTALISEARTLNQLEISARRSAAEARISAELSEINAEAERRKQTVDFEVRNHTAQLEAEELAAIDDDFARRMHATRLAATQTLEHDDPIPAPVKIPAQMNGNVFQF